MLERGRDAETAGKILTSNTVSVSMEAEQFAK